MILKSNENKLRISSLSYLQSKIIEEIYLSVDSGYQISKKKLQKKFITMRRVKFLKMQLVH